MIIRRNIYNVEGRFLGLYQLVCSSGFYNWEYVYSPHIIDDNYLTLEKDYHCSLYIPFHEDDLNGN